MDTNLVLQTLALGMEPGRPESRPSSDVVPGDLVFMHRESVLVWEFLGQNLRLVWAWWAPWFLRTQHPSTETKRLVFISEERHYLPAACWTEISTMGHKIFQQITWVWGNLVKALYHLVTSMPWEMWALRHKHPLCFLSLLCCSFGTAKVQPPWDSWGKEGQDRVGEIRRGKNA